MNPTTSARDRLLLLSIRARLRWSSPRDDRGDVPGWVLVTVVTAR